MSDWKKSNIGNRIGCMDSFGRIYKGIICNVNPEVPNTIDLVGYSLEFNSGTEKYSLVIHKEPVVKFGISKNQEVNGRKYLSKPGDWYFIGVVPREKIPELEDIANKEHIFSGNEDVLNWAIFRSHPEGGMLSSPCI